MPHAAGACDEAALLIASGDADGAVRLLLPLLDPDAPGDPSSPMALLDALLPDRPWLGGPLGRMRTSGPRAVRDAARGRRELMGAVAAAADPRLAAELLLDLAAERDVPVDGDPDMALGHALLSARMGNRDARLVAARLALRGDASWSPPPAEVAALVEGWLDGAPDDDPAFGTAGAMMVHLSTATGDDAHLRRGIATLRAAHVAEGAHAAAEAYDGVTDDEVEALREAAADAVEAPGRRPLQARRWPEGAAHPRVVPADLRRAERVAALVRAAYDVPVGAAEDVAAWLHGWADWPTMWRASRVVGPKSPPDEDAGEAVAGARREWQAWVLKTELTLGDAEAVAAADALAATARDRPCVGPPPRVA